MHLLELPNEVLAYALILAAYSQPTRPKRRKQLLVYATVCRQFSVLCLKQLYSKLAYEISPRGDKLLAALESNPDYASFVQALAVRERESGVTRKLINTRVNKGHPGAAPMNTRQKQATFELVSLDEKRIGDLLQLLKDNIVELKFETNLLPPNDDAFLQLSGSLQTLFLVPQAPYPEAADREARLQAATFTLSLPSAMFLPAFSAYNHLTHLDMWKCNFGEFDGKLESRGRPKFRLATLVLQECTISGDTFKWLLSSTLDAGSLRTLKLAFLPSDSNGLKRVLQKTIASAASQLDSFSFDGDEGDLDERVEQKDISVGEDDATMEMPLSPSVLRDLNRLLSLHLGGPAITEHHWRALPASLFQTLGNLSLSYTPLLPPQAVMDKLLHLPHVNCPLKKAHLKGTEDFRRRNIRELLASSPTQQFSDWAWTRVEFVTFASLLDDREVQWGADRSIVVGNDEDDSDDEDFEMQEDYDETGDFEVTAEQWEQEKQIEAAELERTWASGSEY